LSLVCALLGLVFAAVSATEIALVVLGYQAGRRLKSLRSATRAANV
jgi:hypothetical protein